MYPNDERILVVAPTGQDSTLICEQLKAAGLCCWPRTNLEEFAGAVLEGAGSGLIAEEALTSSGVQRLTEALSAQPAWSDLPLTVLTNSDAYSDREKNDLLRKLADAGNIALLERPLRVVTLVMTTQASLRARRRQYEFREYLQQYERYQAQLRQAQKLESLGVLAGGIAHDFNNILTGILGNASLASEILPADHPAYHLLEDVITSSERAAALTTQMLAYAGKGRFQVQPLDLSELVRNMGDFFRASVPKWIELDVHLESALPSIEADSSQIEQIVMNLVINAAEAIPEGRHGRVQVRTGRHELGPQSTTGFAGEPLPPGTYATLQVRDNGTGMDDETLARIFDPFFTTKFLGRGLGLAAVQGIVREHGGALTVESTHGKGTTFTIFFPVSQAKVARNSEKGGAPVHPGRASILVVDDEEVVRRTAASMLEQHGYSVVTAENGRAAVDLFRELDGRVDVVLLDMTMPVMDGEQTLRELKAVRPDIPVILSSGYNEAEVVRRFAGGEFAGFIQKPYTSSRLREKIRRILEKHASRINAA
jgi:signal transduction histidine kinase